MTALQHANTLNSGMQSDYHSYIMYNITISLLLSKPCPLSRFPRGRLSPRRGSIRSPESGPDSLGEPSNDIYASETFPCSGQLHITLLWAVSPPPTTPLDSGPFFIKFI